MAILMPIRRLTCILPKIMVKPTFGSMRYRADAIVKDHNETQQLFGIISYQTSLPRVVKIFESFLEEQVVGVMPVIQVVKSLPTESPDIAIERMDQMEVPYIVLLKEDLITSGLTFLRWRDNKLTEDVHAKHLVKKLFLYYRSRLPSNHPLKHSEMVIPINSWGTQEQLKKPKSARKRQQDSEVEDEL